MADNNESVKINVDAHVSGDDLVTALTAKMRALEAQAKRINDSFKDIGRVSSSTPGGGKDPAKTEAAAENVRAKSRRSKKQEDADSLKSAKVLDSFDKASIALFKTKLASQTKAASEALKTERQSFANFRTRNAAQSRYESSQVRALKDRLTAERRIATMRSSAEAEVVRQLKQKLGVQSQAQAARLREATAASRTEARQNAEAIRSVRNRISVHGRMMRQRLAEEKFVQREQARSIADAARMETRRMREAAASIRENGRIEAAQVRHVERERSRHETARNRNISNLRSGGEAIREGSGQVLRGSAQITAATTGTAALAARKGISTRMEVDTAETNLKIFSGQTNEQIKEARKGFLDNLSIKNGLGIAGGLDAYSEVLKTGMKAPAENVKTIMEAVSALELDLKNTTKLAGLIDRNYGAKSDPAKIKSALNAVAVAAREDPTQSNEIVEGVKRAFGALSTGNMTPEQLTALVSGGQSVGIQPGKAGTYVATLGKQLSMGNSKFLGKKNREELNFAAKELGFGDARKMASEYTKDSYGTMMKFHERLAAMEPGKRTQVAEAALGRQWSDEGVQFSQGAGGVKKTYGEISDPKNENFLQEAANTRANSLMGQWNSTKTIFGRFWDSFGQGFEDILTSINKYFLELNSSFDYDRVKSYVVDFFEGVKEALGVKTWTELLHNVFGGDIGNIGPSIKAFAKGLTEGVMSIGRAIKSFASVFGGGDMSAEAIGKLSGQFLALSLALIALSPVITVLGGLAAIVGGLAVSAKALSGLAGLAGRGAATGAAGAGAAGAAGAAARVAGGGLGAMLSRFFILGLVAEIGANRVEISAMLTAPIRAYRDKIWESIKTGFTEGFDGQEIRKFFHDAFKSIKDSLIEEFVPAPVRRYLDSKEAEKTPEQKAEEKKVEDAKNGAGLTLLQKMGITSVPTAVKKTFEPLVPRIAPNSPAVTGTYRQFNAELGPTPTLDPRPAMESLKEAVNDNTLIHKQNFEKQTAFGGLIHKASISSPAEAVKSSLAGSSADIRSSTAVLSGSTGSGVMTGGNGPLGNSTPGSALNGGSGLSRRGILGGGGGYAPPSSSMAGKTFDAKAPGIMANLQKDFGLTKEQAAGILGNLGHESAGMTAYQEGKPLGGGRGGAGWAQWTGPRRRQFEAWSAQNGLDSRSDEANYGFLKHELQTTHKGSLASLKRQSTVDGATVDFERNYEAAGVKHYGSRIGYARKAFNGPAAPSQVIGGSVGTDAASNVADNAARLVNLGSGDAARALGSKMTPGQWCADFVNGSLKSANIKGVNSSIANSFLGWGKEVTDGVKKGDVLVEHRGRGIGQTGGHAGIATGNQRMHNGQLQYEQISGNYGNKVSKNWENASGVIARRALETTNRAVEASKAPAAAMRKGTDWNSIPSPVSGSLGLSDKTEAIKSSSWKPSDGNKATAPVADGVEAQNITGRLPGRNADAPGGIPIAGGGNGGNSSSSATTNNININGTGMNSEEIANAVQRKSSEGMRRQTTGASPYSMI